VRVGCWSTISIPGTVRVIWKRTSPRWSDLASRSAPGFWRGQRGAATALREVLAPDKVNWFAPGRNQVAHLHCHVIARFLDDSHFRSRSGRRGMSALTPTNSCSGASRKGFQLDRKDRRVAGATDPVGTVQGVGAARLRLCAEVICAASSCGSICAPEPRIRAPAARRPGGQGGKLGWHRCNCAGTVRVAAASPHRSAADGKCDHRGRSRAITCQCRCRHLVPQARRLTLSGARTSRTPSPPALTGQKRCERAGGRGRSSR